MDDIILPSVLLSAYPMLLHVCYLIESSDAPFIATDLRQADHSS